MEGTAGAPPPPPPAPLAPPAPVRRAEVAEETFDSPKELKKKLKKLARLMKDAKGSVVVYTGAGISTAANIPDYRSSDGLYAHGILRPQSMDLHSVYPTRSHMAVKELMDKGYVSFVVTSNHDNLHKRSGIPDEKIAELFGNGYEEFCLSCGHSYHRKRPVPRIGAHITGRMCEESGCNGRLKNFSVDFGQTIPEEPLKKAMNATKPLGRKPAKLALVLGSSLTVRPFSTFPPLCERMVIVNIQQTPFDKDSLKINSKIDDVMLGLMEELDLSVPPYILQEDVFIEQRKQEGGNVRLIIRGDRFVSCDDFIEKVFIKLSSQEKEKENSLEMQNEKIETAGYFWYELKPEDLPSHDVIVRIEFLPRFHRPAEEFRYNFATKEPSHWEWTFPVDFDSPPDIANVTLGGGGLLDAIKLFPGKEFLQKGGDGDD